MVLKKSIELKWNQLEGDLVASLVDTNGDSGCSIIYFEKHSMQVLFTKHTRKIAEG